MPNKYNNLIFYSTGMAGGANMQFFLCASQSSSTSCTNVWSILEHILSVENKQGERGSGVQRKMNFILICSLVNLVFESPILGKKNIWILVLAKALTDI